MGGGELQRRRVDRAEHDDPLAAKLIEHSHHVVDDALDQATLDRRDGIR
jgi:hypothetical protein